MDIDEAQKQRLNQLNELDEKRLVALHHTTIVKQHRTKWHDRFIKKKVFQKDDWVLLYNSRFKDFKGKLYTRWLGPYRVESAFDNGTVERKTIDDEATMVLANGHRL